MSDEFDINVVFAKVIQSEFDDLKNFVQKKIIFNSAKLTTTFKKYLKDSFKKYTVTKTLLHKETAIDIDDIYIDLDAIYRNTTKSTWFNPLKLESFFIIFRFFIFNRSHIVQTRMRLDRVVVVNINSNSDFGFFNAVIFI